MRSCCLLKIVLVYNYLPRSFRYYVVFDVKLYFFMKQNYHPYKKYASQNAGTYFKMSLAHLLTLSVTHTLKFSNAYISRKHSKCTSLLLASLVN